MVIHIVSGDSALASMKYMIETYGLSSQSKNHVVLRHSDDLSIGPLFDVDSINPSARIAFWRKLWGHDNNIEIEMEADLNKLITTATKVILWYGWNANEILLTRRVAWYLQNNMNLKVSEVVLSKENFQDTIAMVWPEKLWQLYHKTKPVTHNTLKAWAQEWDRIRNIPNCIRIWRNENLETVPETFFDDALLNSIGDDWVLSTRVVGEVMGRSYFRIGDVWLLWRLKDLISIGTVEMQEISPHLQAMHPPGTFYVRKNINL